MVHWLRLANQLTTWIWELFETVVVPGQWRNQMTMAGNLGALYIFILHVDLFCCHYLYVEVFDWMYEYIFNIHMNVHLVCQYIYNWVYMEICRTVSSGDPGEVWWPQLSCQGEHRTEFFWQSGLFRTRIREIREIRTNKLVVSWNHPAAWLRGNKVEGISSYKKMSPEFPERGSVFDWVFNGEVG